MDKNIFVIVSPQYRCGGCRQPCSSGGSRQWDSSHQAGGAAPAWCWRGWQTLWLPRALARPAPRQHKERNLVVFKKMIDRKKKKKQESQTCSPLTSAPSMSLYMAVAACKCTPKSLKGPVASIYLQIWHRNRHMVESAQGPHLERASKVKTSGFPLLQYNEHYYNTRLTEGGAELKVLAVKEETRCRAPNISTMENITLTFTLWDLWASHSWTPDIEEKIAKMSIIAAVGVFGSQIIPNSQLRKCQQEKLESLRSRIGGGRGAHFKITEIRLRFLRLPSWASSPSVRRLPRSSSLWEIQLKFARLTRFWRTFSD